MYDTTVGDIVVATTVVGNETRSYAGLLEKAPEWVYGPNVRARLNGETVTTVPRVAWDVCATGKATCRHACCR